MKMKAAIFVTAAAFVLTACMAFGDDNTITVTVTGKNVNMTKTLCGEDAPASDRNVLSVTTIKDESGNIIDGYTGKLLHYLPEETAMPLMKGNANLDNDVEIKGILYKNAQTLRIIEFNDWDNWDEINIEMKSQAPII